MKKLIVLTTFFAVLCISTLAWAPPSGSSTQIRDRNSNTKADVAQAAATLASTIFGLVDLSVQYFWDGSNPRWVVGAQVNTDDIAETTYMPYHAVFLHYLDEANSDWDRAQGTAAADNLSATQEGIFTLDLNLFYDGSNYRRWQGITAADGLTYPTAPWTLSPIFLDNGATLDMAKSGAVGELLVTDVATRPGEDAGNDWRKIKKEEIAVLQPAATTGTAVTDAGTDVVLASVEVLNWPNWSIWMENAGGGSGNDLADVDVQISGDGTNWSSATSTACDALTSGDYARCYTASNESIRYVQVIAECGAGEDTTVDVNITGNKN